MSLAEASSNCVSLDQATGTCSDQACLGVLVFKSSSHKEAENKSQATAGNLSHLPRKARFPADGENLIYVGPSSPLGSGRDSLLQDESPIDFPENSLVPWSCTRRRVRGARLTFRCS